ncbi:MAG: D-hexose-6-phosphate mutarotase [Actinobacteria bacterium HGW-Actinobacteria-5]|nr:MAG: D-hexose-6-phosphate mutarotase [Actinobacteria bacterium HGW-Actinobacteria-5]
MPENAFPGVEVHFTGGEYAALDVGAQAIAWTPPEQNAVLWLSPLATFEPGAALRGGVPVVFPWFGAGPSGDRTPSHGFARTAAWRREAVLNELATSGRLVVRYSLNEAGLDSAPFTAELTLSFAPGQFEVSLRVVNTGPEVFRYEEALHTYFAVSGIDAVRVDGLAGCAYLDKAAGGGADEIVQAGSVRFTGEVDRVYRHGGDAVIVDPGWSREIVVGKQGSANTVVWNPGPVKGPALADVGLHWTDFVCVEAGNVRDAAIELAPGEEHILTQTIRLR